MLQTQRVYKKREKGNSALLAIRRSYLSATTDVEAGGVRAINTHPVLCTRRKGVDNHTSRKNFVLINKHEIKITKVALGSHTKATSWMFKKMFLDRYTNDY